LEVSSGRVTEGVDTGSAAARAGTAERMVGIMRVESMVNMAVRRRDSKNVKVVCDIARV
jgi:hypothetical protein